MIRVDPATVATAPADAPAPARALAERQLAWLTRLAEIGMEIAETAGRQATAAQGEAEPAPMRDPALVYVRVARAVRLTIALQSRLMADLAGFDRAEGLAAAERKRARVLRVQRLVQRAVEAEAENEGGREGEFEPWTDSRSWEARERLAEAELDAELEGLPFAEVVARICEDLGLAPDRTARIVAAAAEADGPPSPATNAAAFAKPRETCRETPLPAVLEEGGRRGRPPDQERRRCHGCA